MLKSKAIDIIKTFSPEEFKRFLNFVKSPYFSSAKSIVRLADELKNFYPAFDSHSLTENYLYEKVYGKGKFSYSAMKNLMSELILLCEKFLVHDRLNKELNLKEGNSIELLSEFRERKLDNLFKSRSKKFQSFLGKRSIENSEYFTQANKLEILNYQLYLNNHRHNSLIWNGFLKRSSLDLCRNFHSLYLLTNMLVHSAEILGGKPDDSLMIRFVKELDIKSFLKSVKSDESEESFFISIYSNLILLTLEESEEHSEEYYHEIKKSFLKNLHYFSNFDIYNILKSLRSYCIIRMRLMRPHFISEMYEVSKLLIEKVNYSSNTIKWFVGEIFTEVVMLSIYKKDYQFAENFIENYKSYLNKEVSEFETGFTKAYLNLEYGETEKALQLMSGLKPVNGSMKILLKNLFLRAYFEMGYSEEAFSILDSYIHYIKKEKKLSPEKKYLYTLRYNVFLRLFKIKVMPENYSKFDIAELRKDLDRFYFIADKDWYLIKLRELEQFVKRK
ncbi:MAG: hypothetical protein JSS91_02315 [Bacteroidetes bacterium]|nr:hypothetical protein [Bacteroidota bacterium]